MSKRYNSIITAFLIIGSASLIGAGAGIFAFLEFPSYQAKAIVRYSPDAAKTLNRIGSHIHKPFGPAISAEWMVTPEFAKEVSKVLNNDGLVSSLTARQYGGRENLQVRYNAGSGSVEIRVSAPEPSEALDATKAVVTVLIDQDSKAIQFEIERLEASLKGLVSRQQRMKKIVELLTAKINALAADHLLITNNNQLDLTLLLWSDLYSKTIADANAIDLRVERNTDQISAIQALTPTVLSVALEKNLIDSDTKAGLIGCLIAICFVAFVMTYLRAGKK